MTQPGVRFKLRANRMEWLTGKWVENPVQILAFPLFSTAAGMQSSKQSGLWLQAGGSKVHDVH
jgi:hypothetical protein